MSVWCTQSHICTLESSYVPVPCYCQGENIPDMNQRALCLSFLNSLLQNMEPMLVATQSPLFICIWKGLNWLHLFGYLWAKLNLANQGSPCSFWCCCQVSQAFSSLVLILHPGCPSHQSSSHRFGGSCLLPRPIYQALPHSQPPTVMRSLHSLSSCLPPTSFFLWQVDGTSPSRRKGKESTGAHSCFVEWCVGQPGALVGARNQETMGL